MLINGSLPGKCHHWGVGRTGCPCPLSNPRAEPRRNLFPLEPPCPSPQGGDQHGGARLLHSVGWLPGSQPPGLAGGSLGLALRGRGNVQEHHRCVWLCPVLPSVCLGGRVQFSSQSPRDDGLSDFPSDRRPRLCCLGLRILGTESGGKGHFLIHGSRMSPLPVISSLHPFSSTPRGQSVQTESRITL